MGRILALDVGLRRTGVALSDPEQSWAFGRGVIEGGANVLVDAVEKLIEREDVERIVIGLPTSLRGSRPTEQEESVRRLAETIRARVSVPVEFEEERLTSRLGQRLERDAGRKGSDDERAAILILESYLARLKNPR